MPRRRARRRPPKVEIGLRARAGLAQRSRAIVGLLRIRQRRLVLIEIGKLEIVVDGIEVIADLDLIALADIELRHATRLVWANEDHVSLDPALEAGITLVLTTGKPGREDRDQCEYRNCLRRPHVVLRSPKIKSR